MRPECAYHTLASTLGSISERMVCETEQSLGNGGTDLHFTQDRLSDFYNLGLLDSFQVYLDLHHYNVQLKVVLIATFGLSSVTCLAQLLYQFGGGALYRAGLPFSLLHDSPILTL